MEEKKRIERTKKRKGRGGKKRQDFFLKFQGKVGQ